jgi:UDP-glucose 4-epimerase
VAGFVVTGEVGFIGSYPVKKLAEEGCLGVRVIDNLSTGKRENLAPVLEGIYFQLGNIREDETMKVRKKVT